MENPKVIILGAGLSGLHSAYLLKKRGIDAILLEARDRVGGRIHTISQDKTTLELGATWFADKHVHLSTLLDELGIDKVEQDYGRFAIYEYPDGKAQLFELPQQQEASYRIKGGTSVLIDTLFQYLNTKQVQLNTSVQSIDFTQSEIIVSTDKGEFKADTVINTLPPNLFVNSITCQPELQPEDLLLFQNTHTWMGESIKVGLFSPHPFWRDKEIGTIYSQRGPITEMYDHSNEEGFALKGFIHDQLIQLNWVEREAAVRQQLISFFGEELINQCVYVEATWKEDPFTYAPYQQAPIPHQNNGHQKLRETHFNDRLIMAGSESAIQFPGYLDGAIEASTLAIQKLESNYAQSY